MLPTFLTGASSAGLHRSSRTSCVFVAFPANAAEFIKVPADSRVQCSRINLPASGCDQGSVWYRSQERSKYRLVSQKTGKSDERFARVVAHDGFQVLSPKAPVKKHREKTEEVQMNMRKSRFLLSTAVLLAGVSLAAAQGTREGSGGGMGAGSGAAERDKSGSGMSQGHGGASRGEGMTQGRAAEPRGGGRAESPAAGQSRTERSEGMKEGGRAAERGQIGKDQQSQKDQTVGQRRGDRDQPRQSEQKTQDKDQSYGKQNSQSTGQGRGEHDQTRQSEQKTPQGQKDQSTTTGANTRPSNAPAPDQATQGQTTQQNQGATTGTQATAPAQNQSTTTQTMSGRASVNAQQQTTLQQSVLSSRNVARVNANSINFQVNTGVVVPRNINVVSVSAFPALINVFPDFRDDSFFVVDDEIVVLDRSRRIVDVVPAGPRTRFSRAGSGGGISGGSVAALNLSPEEIRVVQHVLIERGLLTGGADGVLGTRTREALITFQRQQGIQASGSIDTRTVSALGVSDKISATQSQTTTGQGQANQQRPTQQGTTGQNTGQANAPAQQNQPTTGQAQQNQPATTGQAQPNQPATTGQAQQNQPATTGQAQQNQPATTGQGGTQQPSGQTTGQAAPPAQGNNPPAAHQNMPSGQPDQSNPPASSQPADHSQGKKY
ncbi:peptidoglycan-binding protein [Bradyrhizobium huanghuaihaiense]|uniref:peptidoglycan-binding protein n=1 Tax=Bradyrhizobium huanghuaihaiense TaxID=990078 RepID=UPI0021AA8BCC|nr:peptidoglycan-binding protein [Bradyrhizobium sp. CB3035]UWU77869.1 peptidoglycan-binding protein [Bradyrhizobium sp. CB3035]